MVSSYFNVTRARELGIYSPYRSVDELYVADPMNASVWRLDTGRAAIALRNVPGALLNIKAFQDRVGVGCGGWGVDLPLLFTLTPVVLWFVAIVVLRYLCREPLGRFGIYMGVVTENGAQHAGRVAAGRRGTAALSRRNRRKIFKFQNQLWLTVFYIASTIFGYVVQRDKPWFRLPLHDRSSLHLLLPHPYLPAADLLVYYHYELAFYLAELFSLLFVETAVKRSDFIEYVIHHTTTITLIVSSHVGWEHRFGAYVLFIHDASDIMLSLSKTLHYMVEEEVARAGRFNALHARLRDGKRYVQHALFKYVLTETLVNACFGLFIAVFFFMRLYCLPLMLNGSFRMASMVRHGSVNYWMLAILLNVVLQSLHIYWAALIVNMVARMACGGERKDIRSEVEDDGEQPDVTHWHSLKPDAPSADRVIHKVEKAMSLIK